MLRLLKIELKKLYPNRYFRILGALWGVAFLAMPIGLWSFLLWFERKVIDSEDFAFLKPTEWPVFDFVDIWQNVAYLYKCITIFLCFIVIASVTNDFESKTIRQNIIDGLSRKEFWLSKISFLLFISTLTTALVGIFTLILGFLFSPVTELEFVFKNMEFLGAYFIHVFYFLSFCLVVSLLIKRALFVFPFILFWIYILEFIPGMIITHKYKQEFLADLLPAEAGWNLIRMPFEKYFLRYSQDFVSAQDVLIAGGWIAIFLLISYLLVVKRDLK